MMQTSVLGMYNFTDLFITIWNILDVIYWHAKFKISLYPRVTVY